MMTEDKLKPGYSKVTNWQIDVKHAAYFVDKDDSVSKLAT